MKEEIKVWDIWIRLFHWTLVSLILFSWLSAELGGNWMIWHTQAGFITAGLIVFRILWGFMGSSRARFASFVRRPKIVADYLRDSDKKTYLGHNPLGAIGVVVLIVLISLQVITGLFSNDDIFIEGPLAQFISYDTSLAITDAHELIFKLLMINIAIHVGAVIFYQRIKKQPLIQAMFHGRKPANNSADLTQFAPLASILTALAIAAGVSIWLFSIG